MRWPRCTKVVVFAFVLFLSACGGGGTTTPSPSSGNPPGSNTAPISVAVTDSPPAGISVLSFEVTVTSAVLQPGNVQLIASPLQIEVKRLEVEAAFLSTVNVPAGTYTSIAVTFTNPELTIRNDSNTGIIAICAVGAICEFKPAATGTFTFSGSPFPLTITANQAAGLLLDVNLNNLITGANAVDFTAAGGLVVTQLIAAQGTGRLAEMEDISGRVTAVRASSNEFDLQLASGRTLTFRVDANTEFEDFDDPGGINCPVNNFSCLAMGQVVEVDARLMVGGGLLAREVEAEDNDNQEELEGIIVGINSQTTAVTEFEIVVIHESLNAAALEVGNRAVINVLNPANSGTFRVDDDDLPVNSADFDDPSDLIVGQVVEVERDSTPVGTPPKFDTDRVKLKDTRLTGRIQTVDATNNRIVLDSLPLFFGLSTLEVRVTPGETEFSDTPGLGALAANDVISVRGLLFRGSTTPFLMAKKIRKR